MGGDVLVCQSGDGHDTTGDFNHHGDPDHLRHGGNTVITFPEGGSITLVNVKAGTLDATDFSFHQKLAVDGIQTSGGRRASQGMSRHVSIEEAALPGFDMNILSPAPDVAVAAWLAEQTTSRSHLTAVKEAELWRLRRQTDGGISCGKTGTQASHRFHQPHSSVRQHRLKSLDSNLSINHFVRKQNLSVLIVLEELV